jgi:queuine tRNA-ribosyltransferase
MPTRNARNGMLFTANGTIISKQKWRMISPIRRDGNYFVDTEYTKLFTSPFAANEYLENKLQPFTILGFTCGWFVRLENIS